MSDFGGLIRDAREKLGMSPHRVAELIGRASGTVKAWERGRTVPNDPLVVSSLAAVLALDETRLFEAANLSPPDHRQALTIEQELATIAPSRPAGVAPKPAPPESMPPPGDHDSELAVDEPIERPLPAPVAAPRPERVSDVDTNEPVSESLNVSELIEKGAELVAEAGAPLLERLRGTGAAPSVSRRKKEKAPRPRAAMAARPQAPAVAPSPVVPVARPLPASGSYLDDPEERWSYRLRTLWTAAGVAVLGVLLLWAGSRALDAFGDTWDALLAGL